MGAGNWRRQANNKMQNRQGKKRKKGKKEKGTPVKRKGEENGKVGG